MTISSDELPCGALASAPEIVLLDIILSPFESKLNILHFIINRLKVKQEWYKTYEKWHMTEQKDFSKAAGWVRLKKNNKQNG